MLLGVFASCNNVPDDTESNEETALTETESATEGNLENNSETDSQVTENTTDSESESVTEETESEVKDSEKLEHPIPDGEYGKAISNANNLWGGVNLYYQDGTRRDITIENNNMSLSLHAAPDGNALITNIKNTKGKSYLENTMDVFIKMQDGRTFYSSKSMTSMSFDLYRFGMYYYELRAQRQTFVESIIEHKDVDLGIESAITERYYEMSKPTLVDGAIVTTMLDKNDPRIYYDKNCYTAFSAEEYNYLAVDVKVTSPDMSYQRSLTTFAWSENDSINPASETTVSILNDGEFHTYYFKLDNSDKYTGKINQFRFDYGGIIGDVIEYKNVRAVKADVNGVPDLTLCRYLHTYSDKNQQVIQVSAKKDTTGIEEIGIITKIAEDTVDKLVVKDKNGTHDTLNGVDWDSVEYIGFDIKGVGIFGYILLPDSGYALAGRTQRHYVDSGRLNVTLENGEYIIIQSKAPVDNKIDAPAATDDPEIDNIAENFDNCADFFIGQRLYTDENHNFDEFLRIAEIERHPLSSENIVVDTENSTGAKFLGYDCLRGAYVFNVDGSNFNRPYYEEPNKHFNVKFTVTGDEYDRNMYLMTTTAHGELQCAAILDANNLLLPIPVEVGKNFTDGGETSFDAKDEPGSEAYFPMYITAGEEKTFNFLNLYMNWGRVPLKQISFIQLAPLYHLSTGVTETNCILPWYSNMGSTRNIWTLPDHRPMSAPFWATQPNHTSGGDHRFLRYTDSEGNFIATEIKSNYITNYGPTYAELVMDYLSDDGRIAVRYTHMEMPQTDETRTYYTMEYTVLEDVSFNNFKDDFIFYSMNPFNGVGYQRIGYLNENNECVTRPTESRPERARYYILGDECPYFSYFQDDDCQNSKGYVNLSFLIYESEFNLQELTQAPNFVIKEHQKHIYLSLDLEKITLKKGDTIKINCIIMPWGSQESDYTLEDKNVRDVRESCLLNPLTVTVDSKSGCTVMESDFLPRIKIDNGKNGTFTISGGCNNSTIELYGLTSMSVPQIYEDKDGQWTRYNLSSQHYPDKSGFGQSYDGYAIKYNPDGTYTYSFVVNMKDGAPRKFRVVVSDSISPEPVPEYDPNEVIYGEAGIVEGPNLMMDARTLLENISKTAASQGMDTSKTKIIKDGDGEYLRFCAQNGRNEVWILPFTVPAQPIKTGKYLTIKYRMPSTNTKYTRFEIWTSTKASVVAAENMFSYYKDYISADDQWKILVIDLSQMAGLTYEPAPNGDYYANFLRFDLFDSGYSDGSYIDIQYISFDDRAEDIFAYPYNQGFDTVTYYDGRVLDVFTTDTEFPAPKTVYEDDMAEYENIFNLYLSAKKLAHLGSRTTEFGNVTLFEKDGFVRFNSHAFSSESDFTIYRSEEGAETGRYLVIKYRANAGQDNYLQFYATTLDLYDENENPEGKRYFDESNVVSLSNSRFIRNGEWQIAIVDFATITEQFTAAEDGKYYATWVRFDPFNGKQGTTANYIDVAYVAMCDDLTAAVTYDKSVSSAYVRVDSATDRRYSTESGNVQ